ncbi:MAG: CDP-diacylglycerol--glycerol-3-phosphate 3-phosphatidyltransferase [Elusimicrobia bacterium]|nr:CDP-diacylglycerol--glycerol-3-phosphate 3-phosphatidyltransferase [Elusimicrobiota bacterium]
MTLANQLTVLRFVLALAMFMALLRPEPGFHLLALFLFLAAVITDWIDGTIARMTNSISPFGKVADPIADKILVVGALIALTRAKLGIPLWGIFLIIIRELLIGGLRMIESAHGKIPAAQPWGKWKMGLQSVSVLAMLAILVARGYLSWTPPWAFQLPYYLTVLCVIVAWNSAYQYFKHSRKTLEKSWG